MKMVKEDQRSKLKFPSYSIFSQSAAGKTINAFSHFHGFITETTFGVLQKTLPTA